jgi:hypothetical protein
VQARYFWWPSRVMCIVLGWVHSLVIVLPLWVLGLVLGLDGTPVFLVVLLPIYWFTFRALTLTLEVDDDEGVSVRNLWRTYRFPWREIEAITFVAPGNVKRAPVLAFEPRGGGRRVAALACIAFTTSQRRTLAALAAHLAQRFDVAIDQRRAGLVGIPHAS